MSPITESSSSKFLANPEAIDELRQILGAAEVTPAEHGLTFPWHDPNGYLEGWSTLYFIDDGVHWAMLQASRAGTMTRLTGVMPDFLRSQGFVRLTAPGWPGAWQWLEAIGLEKVSGHQDWMTPEWLAITGCEDWDGDELDIFVSDLTKPTRFAEYSAWKQGNATEPSWHQTVAGRRNQK